MPTPSNYYVRPTLAGVAKGYKDGGFVAEDIFPTVKSTKQTGFFFDIDPNRRYQTPQDDSRGPGAEAKRMGYDDPGQIPYFAEDHALIGLLPDEIRSQVEAEAEAAVPTIERLVYKLLLKKEVNLVSVLGTLSQTATPTTKWDNSAGSAVNDILNQKETIRRAVGQDPNTIVITQQVLDKLVQTPDWSKATHNGAYTLSELKTIGAARLLADAVGVENVRVAGGYKNTSNPGQAADMQSIWGPNCLLSFCDNPRALMGPTQALGITIVPEGVVEGAEVMGGFKVASWRDEERASEAFKAHYFYKLQLLNANAGFWFTSVLT